MVETETPIHKEPTSFEEAKEQLLAKMSENPSSCELYSSIAMNAEGVALVFSTSGRIIFWQFE